MFNPDHNMVVTHASAWNAVTNPLSSSFIPGNIDYYADDVRDSDFYEDLEGRCTSLRPA